MKKQASMMHGWLGYGNKEELLRMMNTPNIKTICELGSWYGKSAEFMMNYMPQLNLICVDLWDNDDIKEGNQVIPYSENHGKIKQLIDDYPLYNTFLNNLYEHRANLMPLKMDTLDGLKEMHARNIIPDAIYIDANHTYKNVKGEIELSLELFPDVILFGDDMNWKGVARAVVECAKKYNFRLIKNRNCWRYFKELPSNLLENTKILIIV